MNPNISFPRGSRWRKHGLRSAIGAFAAAALALAPVVPAPAHASIAEAEAEAEAEVEVKATAEVESWGQGALGLNVTGYLPATAVVPDPTEPYPPAPPVDGVPRRDFMGLIDIKPADRPLRGAYSLGARSHTEAGVRYESGTWSAVTSVPNLGYVAHVVERSHWLLRDLTPEAQAAATQAAIWYFTDGMVLDTTAEVRAATEMLVTDAQHGGPLIEPDVSGFSVTPSSQRAAADRAAGPFTVTVQGSVGASVSVPAGYAMYSDPDAATPIANHDSVSSGSEVWVTGPGVTAPAPALTVRGELILPAGTVFLPSGDASANAAPPPLVLSIATWFTAEATTSVEFYAEEGSEGGLGPAVPQPTPTPTPVPRPQEPGADSTTTPVPAPQDPGVDSAQTPPSADAQESTDAEAQLASTGGVSPWPVLGTAVGAIGLGVLLTVAVRARRRAAE